MLHETGPGRVEVEYGAAPDEAALGVALDEAFADEAVTVAAWWVPVGDWHARRTAWRLGFTYGGVLRGWAGGDDAWAYTLRRDDPRKPASPWLDNPVVEGDGVRLRPFTDADVPRVVEGIGDPATQHWLSFMPRNPGEEEGRRYLEVVLDRLATNHTVTWAFASPDDDLLLGVVGLYRLDAEPELGYWAHPEARGRGVTTRAAALAVGHAFDVLGLERLAAYAAEGNAASLRVLESVGMRRAGVQRRAARTGDGVAVDLVAYDLLAEERASTRR